MIKGYEDLTGMINLLKGLDLAGFVPAFSTEVADYVVRYGGSSSVLSDSHEDVEEEDVTAEEMRLLGLLDPAQASMFDDKLNDVILGTEEDE